MGLLSRIEEREKSQLAAKKETAGCIETDIDKVHNMVGKYGSMTLKDIAVALKLSAERVEELAKILNKYKMAEIYYPPLGSAALRRAGGIKSEKRIGNKNLNLLIFGSAALIILIAAIAIMRIYGSL